MNIKFPEHQPEAIGAEDISFDNIYFEETKKISFNYDHLLYHMNGEKNLKLHVTTNNQFHSTIFKAIISGLYSYWGHTTDERINVLTKDLIRPFINWINTYDSSRTEQEKYSCLIAYDVYRRNEMQLKTSTINRIKKIIRHGIECEQLSSNERLYLTTLVKLSKEVPAQEADSYTLTRWFSIPWLREILGDRLYLQIESAKRLVTSLRVTSAITLLYLLERREEWQQRFSLADSSPPISPKKRDANFKLNYWLLRHIAKFDTNGQPSDALTEILLLDIFESNVLNYLRSTITSADEWYQLPVKRKFHGKLLNIWQTPRVFTADYHYNYSMLEEMLAAWLCACEAIQPSDICKLKSTNYAIEYNENGRMLFMQLQYYKGRAGNRKEPEMLMASDIWTQAQYRYIKQLQNPGLLFRSPVYQRFNPLSFAKRISVSHLNLLSLIWKLPEVETQLNKEFSRAKASSVFLTAMLALESSLPREGSIRNSDDHEFNHICRPVPASFFTLTYIKNSAVHARSDQYRDSDLINHNSHTSQTEKYNYLTDANKEWVNQCGRITRIVLHDLQKVVYQPSIEKMEKDVNDLNLRTKIMAATGKNDWQVRNLKNSTLFSDDENVDDIIITDTLDSALYFIHYITQSESNFSQLLRVRPDFVQRTLIIQIEWMTRLLNKLSYTKEAYKEYSQLSEHLPPLFDHIIVSAE